MKPAFKDMHFHAQQANHEAERAFWWVKGIDAEAVREIGLTDKIQSVLSLLQKVDNITLDIMITIKNKSKE